MPFVQAKIAEHYDTSGASGVNRCPGEDECDDFQQPFAGSYEQKCEAICRGCPFVLTKPKRSAHSTEEMEFLFTEAMTVRRRRDSGCGLDLESISPLTFNLILHIDDTVDVYERTLRMYAKALFEALIKR